MVQQALQEDCNPRQMRLGLGQRSVAAIAAVGMFSRRIERLRSVAGQGGTLTRARRIIFYVLARATARLSGTFGAGALLERIRLRSRLRLQKHSEIDPILLRQPAPVRPVTTTRIDCRKRPIVRSETSLFVSYSPNGYLKRHVRGYLEALVREGIGVILIVATDAEFIGDELWLRKLVDGLFVRENEGFDFAAWAHVLRLHPRLRRAEMLYLLNDSVIGPVSEAAFHAAIERVRAAPGDIVGMTENYDRGWHIQSYFLALRKRALRSGAWKKFVLKIASLADKDEVINSYEVRLASVMQAAGFRTAVVFKSEFRSDPTVFLWRELLEQGFPFLKIKTIRDEIPGVDSSGWRQALEAAGFDVAIADEILAQD